MSVSSRRRGRSCDKTSNLVSSETDNISLPDSTTPQTRCGERTQATTEQREATTKMGEATMGTFG